MLNRVLKCASTARVTGRWRLNNLILRSSENNLETIVPSLISRLIFFFQTWEGPGVQLTRRLASITHNMM